MQKITVVLVGEVFFSNFLELPFCRAEFKTGPSDAPGPYFEQRGFTNIPNVLFPDREHFTKWDAKIYFINPP